MGTANLVLPSVCTRMSVFMLINKMPLGKFSGPDAIWHGVASIHAVAFVASGLRQCMQDACRERLLARPRLVPESCQELFRRVPRII